MSLAQVNPGFWSGKKIFLTGHTGFKGSWMTLWLTSLGAKVTGYSLAPTSQPCLFEVLENKSFMEASLFADICDLASLRSAMNKAAPDIVIHMAAQALVRYSYKNPIETYATNVMGTANLLEATRGNDTVRATLVVTTDKCYENREWVWPYRENERMGGYDPYSSSKGCAELVTAAYQRSFFSHPNSVNNVASARAGNVIGGGDWSEDRLIPDLIRALEKKQAMVVRNPLAVRPWQHVLEPLGGYLILAQALYEQGVTYASAWNFGPYDMDNRSVKDVIDLLLSGWKKSLVLENNTSQQPHEASILKLDCSKAHAHLGWTPKWRLEYAIQKIIEWQKAFKAQENMRAVCLSQINQYMDSEQ
jgi:CDP-glucose 4,6-dehydratase